MMQAIPRDQAERTLAATDFEQNIVVTAGAGTGKTTLLIQRLLHLLLRSPNPLALTEIVALTFTKKSANELNLRLRLSLEALLAPDCPREKIEDFTQAYGLSLSELTSRVQAAIDLMARSEIGTIHHFASAVLRRYPLEAGVDPHFVIDEKGLAFEDRFQKRWASWLEKELSLESEHKIEWKTLLSVFTLSDLEAFVRCLVSEESVMESQPEEPEGSLAPALKTWLESLQKESADLLAQYSGKRKIETMLEASNQLFRHCIQTGTPKTIEDQVRNLLEGASAPGKVKGWDLVDSLVALRLIRTAQKLLEVDAAALQKVRALLAPFIADFQAATRRAAEISFDDLLLKTRDLLRDHGHIREALKIRYKSILIDEFQDTDPVQYEILLFLSERLGAQQKTWPKVRLEPGKLFVVGDPKQSIYGFRRADIAAYHAVREFILSQGGRHVFLTTNFRSHQGILDVVNGLCAPLIQNKAGLQADYIPIQAAEQNEETFQRTQGLVFRSVGLGYLVPSDDNLDAQKARQQEAAAVASWLDSSVIGHQKIRGQDGVIRTVCPSDIAILMRSLTGVQPFLEALRARGIDYLVEGERHFYRKAIIIDTINLLVAITDPGDRVALVAVLRSPIGGVDDQVLYQMHQSGGLHRSDLAYLGLADWPLTQNLLKTFDTLQLDVSLLSVSDAWDVILDQIPVDLIAAASVEGEQALANLEKLRRQTLQMACDETKGLAEVVTQLKKALLQDLEETESPLAEEGMEAVRISSIHKAKGLEFAVVVLAGCHSGDRPADRARAIIRRDWTTSLVGMRIANTCDMASVFLAQKEQAREVEEEKRILYVAMTRAREHLLFSAAGKRFGRGSMLSQFEEALGDGSLKERLEEEKGLITIGTGVVQLFPHEIAPFDSKTHTNQENQITLEDDFATLWPERRARCEQIQTQKVFISPTALKTADEASEIFISRQMRVQRIDLDARLVGELSHRFMEDWDFTQSPKALHNHIVHFLSQQDLSQGNTEISLIQAEMETIFSVFFQSDCYQELCQATIVSRELPFLMPWGKQVMEGTIDLLYELDGKLYVADYKTDWVTENELGEVVKNYKKQAEIYPEAIRRSFQREVAGIAFIFLRLGVSVLVKGGRGGI